MSYGEVRIKVGDEFFYSKIMTLEYGVKGEYIPAVNYPTTECVKPEYPEIIIKKIILDVQDSSEEFYKLDIGDTLEVINLTLDLGCPYEYSYINFIKNIDLTRYCDLIFEVV